MRALVLYHSQEFGNTGKMAEAVARGLREAGCEVDTHNTNEGRFNVDGFTDYDCVAFGSPDYYSYVAGGLKTFMDDHYVARVRRGVRGLQGKPYALFYSHGGGGKVRSAMLGLFKFVGDLVGEPVGCHGAPSPQVIEQCAELGRKLVESV